MIDSAIGKVCPNCGNTEVSSDTPPVPPANTIASADTPVPTLNPAPNPEPAPVAAPVATAPAMPAPAPTISRKPASSMVAPASSPEVSAEPAASDAAPAISAPREAPAAHALHSRIRVISPSPGFNPAASPAADAKTADPVPTPPIVEAAPVTPPPVVSPLVAEPISIPAPTTPVLESAPSAPEPPLSESSAPPSPPSPEPIAPPLPQPVAPPVEPTPTAPTVTPGVAVPTMKSPANPPTPTAATFAMPTEPLQPVTPGAPPPLPPTPLMFDMSPAPNRKPVVFAVIAAIILLGGGVAFAAKSYLIDPKLAPGAYMNKLISAKTGQFNVDASYSEPEDATASSLVTGSLTLKASGSYDVSKPDTPITDTKLAVNYSQYKIGGEIMTQPNTLYFKISDTAFLRSLGISLSDDWYSYPLDKEQNTQKCSLNKSKSGSLFGLSFPRTLPVKNAKRVGFYEKVDGHYTSHYRGTVDLDKLATVIDDANKQLSADCKIDYDKDSMKDTTVSYDIWRGHNYDRSQFAITESSSKSKATITVDTKNYNKPVKITAPKNAKKFDLSGLEGTDDGSPTADEDRTVDLYEFDSALADAAASAQGAYPASGTKPSGFSGNYTITATPRNLTTTTIFYATKYSCNTAGNQIIPDPSAAVYAVATMMDDGTLKCLTNGPTITTKS